MEDKFQDLKSWTVLVVMGAIDLVRHLREQNRQFEAQGESAAWSPSFAISLLFPQLI